VVRENKEWTKKRKAIWGIVSLVVVLPVLVVLLLGAVVVAGLSDHPIADTIMNLYLSLFKVELVVLPYLVFLTYDQDTMTTQSSKLRHGLVSVIVGGVFACIGLFLVMFLFYVLGYIMTEVLNYKAP